MTNSSSLMERLLNVGSMHDDQDIARLAYDAAEALKNAAPPAPSVAVKALTDKIIEQAAIAACKDNVSRIHAEVNARGGSNSMSGSEYYAYPPAGWRDFKASIRAAIETALSAQVQDDSEIVDCLLAGKPFVFDPATHFCHADDGGAPEHGIKYVPTEQVQDVAGWQLVPKDDESRCLADSALPHEMIEAGIRVQEQVNDDHCNYVAGETTDWDCGMVAVAIYRAMLAAAPAKQEGGHDALEEN